jgi:transcription elongation factor GreA
MVDFGGHPWTAEARGAVLERTRDKLEKELKALEREYRHELPKEIQRALQMGDLRENAEYQSALERQHFVKSRIAQVQQQLQNLSMIDLKALPRDRAALGSTVTVYDAEADRSTTYELVLPEESDFPKGLVSVTSPIGRAIMGRKEGDEVTVKLPVGTRVFEITKLLTLHDKEGA